MAFVPTTGVQVALQGGLQYVCGRTSTSAPVARGKAKNNTNTTAPRMTIGDQGITLQRFVYEPNPGALSVQDKDLMCERVWKQVFGNAYVMESERAQAYKAESMYRAGLIPMKEFVRAIALTETYRRRFFDSCTAMRAVELNLKHLLGRAPVSKAEMSEHIARIHTDGFEADINSYIDSPEYDLAFSDDYVPAPRFKGTYPTIEEFNRMCAFNRAPGRTDKSLTQRAAQVGVENPNTVLSLDGAGTTAKFFMTTVMNGTSAFPGISSGIPKRANVDFGDTNPTPPVGRRIEVVPGSYMYLTPEEESEYKKQAFDTVKTITMVETELAEVKTLRAALDARIALLETA